ncbi:MAG: PKD domain-containing protein [Bacteroidetes bacterium]|nr:PKD domain-containing protein [Bacteroidota bacterium]
MKNIFFTTLIACSIICSIAQAQYGCTDPKANNYNAAATINDGTCTYNSSNLSLTFKTNLATPKLDENSGIEFTPLGLWTFNDSGNLSEIYRIDSLTNTILQTVTITNATNNDWEDITSNNDYIFIGDFGNNNGTRQNLKIYRIAKSQLQPLVTSVTADVINFNYADQTTFVSLPNNNNYDCEAMIFYNDSLHLFSKNWVDKQCKHYVLPAVPGTYTTPVRETFNAGFLITAASVQAGGVISLIGYDNTGVAPVSMWMLYDYTAPFFFNGNRRKFNLSNALTNGQVEGISFRNGAYGYISNERFQQSIFNVAPKLQAFNLAQYLPASFVTPKPKPAFYASDSTICKKDSITFFDASTNNATTFIWTFTGGTPASSTLKNPTVKYNTTGNFAVKLKATNAGGSDSITKTNFIKVNALPLNTVTVVGLLDLCPGDSVELKAATGNNFGYVWFRNGVTIANANKFNLIVKQSGSYKVRLTNNNGCTNTSAVKKVTTLCTPRIAAYNNFETNIFPNPSTSFFELNVEEGEEIPLTISIYDVMGALVFQSPLEPNTNFIFGNDLKPGVYTVHVNYVSKQVFTRIVKM